MNYYWIKFSIFEIKIYWGQFRKPKLIFLFILFFIHLSIHLSIYLEYDRRNTRSEMSNRRGRSAGRKGNHRRHRWVLRHSWYIKYHFRFYIREKHYRVKGLDNGISLSQWPCVDSESGIWKSTNCVGNITTAKK